jgi:hypothetical protein
LKKILHAWDLLKCCQVKSGKSNANSFRLNVTLFQAKVEKTTFKSGFKADWVPVGFKSAFECRLFNFSLKNVKEFINVIVVFFAFGMTWL